MRTFRDIYDGFYNLSLRKKLILLISIMIFFVFLNGIIGFYVGHTRIFSYYGLLVLIGITALIITLTLPLLVFITESITKTVKLLANRMKQVALGNLNIEQQPAYKNELGELNQSFNQITNKICALLERERNTSEKEIKLRQREEFLRHMVLSSITSLELKDVFRTAVVDTGKLYNSMRCHFAEYDMKNDKFLPIQDYQSYVSDIKYKPIIGYTITKEIFHPFLQILLGQKQPIAVGNIDVLELPDKTRQFFTEYQIKSFLAAPVFFRNIPLGVLILDFDTTTKNFTEDDINLLSSIADQLAAVFHQTQLF